MTALPIQWRQPLGQSAEREMQPLGQSAEREMQPLGQSAEREILAERGGFEPPIGD